MKTEKSPGYSFCLFRIPEDGGRIIWEITNQCNYTCGYCIFNSGKEKNPNELNTTEVYRALEELQKSGFSYLKFTGGEPFMRKDFMNILGRANDLGFTSDVSTNASLIRQDTAERLKGLTKMVHVSVDGHNQRTHEMARGERTYKPTIRGVRNLIRQGNYVRIGTILFKGNENHLEEMIRSFASLGVNEVIFSFMEPVGRLGGDSTVISNRGVTEIKQEVEELALEYSGQIKVNHSFTEIPQDNCDGECPSVKKFLYIDNLGRISPCTWVVEDMPQYRCHKTLKGSSFEEILASDPIKAYLKFIEQLKQSGLVGCPVRRRQ